MNVFKGGQLTSEQVLPATNAALSCLKPNIIGQEFVTSTITINGQYTGVGAGPVVLTALQVVHEHRGRGGNIRAIDQNFLFEDKGVYSGYDILAFRSYQKIGEQGFDNSRNNPEKLQNAMVLDAELFAKCKEYGL